MRGIVIIDEGDVRINVRISHGFVTLRSLVCIIKDASGYGD